MKAEGDTHEGRNRRLSVVAKGILLAVLITVLFPSSIPPLSSAASNQVIVTQPECFFLGIVPTTMNATVHANVTSAVPVRNATFYYRTVPANQGGPIPQPYNLSLYRHVFMYLTTNTSDTYTYVTFPLPRFADNTLLFGFVKVFDVQGDVGYSNSDGYPVQTCYFQYFTPNATLDLGLYVSDVNPRYLNLTGELSANLQNSETFSPVTIALEYPPYTIYVNQPQDHTFVYYYTKATVTLYYYGIPQLFPLDSYSYQFTLSLGNLNYSKVTLNGKLLSPSSVVTGLVGYTGQSTQQVEDQSIWNLTSWAQFTPSSNPKQPSSVSITIQITRKGGAITYYVEVPLISVYALLGLSVLMNRKNDLSNRLVVYLTVFVFAYALDANIHSSIVSPFALGPTMAELLALALIPCTVVLAGFSIIRWIPKIRKVGNVIDFIGVSASGATLWFYAQFSVRQYVLVNGSYQLQNVPYTLWSLGGAGGFGVQLILALVFSGLVASVIRLVYWYRRRGWLWRHWSWRAILRW